MRSESPFVSAQGNSYTNGLGVEIFSTGMVARLARVAPRTINKWFDRGLMIGAYKIGNDRRFPKKCVVESLHRMGIPIPNCLREGVLFCGLSKTVVDSLNIDKSEHFNSLVELGMRIGTNAGYFQIVLDAGNLGRTETLKAAAAIKKTSSYVRVIGIGSEDDTISNDWRDFDKVFLRPLDMLEVVRTIREV